MSDVAAVVRKRILVAEDDPAILRLVRIILRRAGYEVDPASNGRDALEKIDAAPYDAMLLDLMMPEMSGFDVLARLELRCPQQKFVVVMSAASPDVLTKAASPVVFATLRKPFDLDELVATVGACVAAREQSVEAGIDVTQNWAYAALLLAHA